MWEESVHHEKGDTSDKLYIGNACQKAFAKKQNKNQHLFIILAYNFSQFYFVNLEAELSLPKQ